MLEIIEAWMPRMKLELLRFNAEAAIPGSTGRTRFCPKYTLPVFPIPNKARAHMKGW